MFILVVYNALPACLLLRKLVLPCWVGFDGTQRRGALEKEGNFNASAAGLEPPAGNRYAW